MARAGSRKRQNATRFENRLDRRENGKAIDPSTRNAGEVCERPATGQAVKVSRAGLSVLQAAARRPTTGAEGKAEEDEWIATVSRLRHSHGLKRPVSSVSDAGWAAGRQRKESSGRPSDRVRLGAGKTAEAPAPAGYHGDRPVPVGWVITDRGGGRLGAGDIEIAPIIPK